MHQRRSASDMFEIITNAQHHSKRKHRGMNKHKHHKHNREKHLLLNEGPFQENSVKTVIDSVKSRNQRTHGSGKASTHWHQRQQIKSNIPQRLAPSEDEGTCHFEAGGKFVDMEGHQDFRGSGQGEGPGPTVPDNEDYYDYDMNNEIVTLMQTDPPQTTAPTQDKLTSSTETDTFVFESQEDNVNMKKIVQPKNRTKESAPHYHWTSRMTGLLTTWSPSSSLMQTTPKLGVTDDIIFSGAGPGCHSDDEDDCTSIGSGADDGIITPTIIIKTTPAPPTTTTQKPRRKPSGNNPWTDESMSSTSNRGVNLNPEGTDQGKPGSIDSLMPTGETSGGSVSNGAGGGSPLNIGLIIGIAAGVLVAILILIFALYKFRSRDEGTYKVDESQNFSYLESKKQQGNGALLGKGEETGGKRGKKKDVKEWYV